MLGKSAEPVREKRLRPSGGYRELRSFQVATIIYDATVRFCERFVDSRSRTVDQMVQAARSGRQNIAEGSRAAAASSQTELRLVNVARASLDELLLDYEDFLRQRHLPAWDKNSPDAKAVRALGFPHPTDPPDLSDPSDVGDRARWALYAPWLEHADPAVIANAMICLIHQANYLLDQQIAALERGFIRDGGYSEKLAVARIAERQRSHRHPSDPTDRTDPSDLATAHAPNCQRCGKPMALRTAHKGPNAGAQFWGCSGYPDCKATQPLENRP
ncbi:MAG: four helix bundle suffix domain-containing protein [Kiritimatiellia bacterium]|jgi:four helix bundle suffix protein|nr:four helix bundle suffix domain-containing protein [Kiritimatiellia bacterium]